MPKLIQEGGFNASESPLPVPSGSVTRELVRAVVGVPAVAYQTPNGGTVFARYPSPDTVEACGLRANLRASALCGMLLFGVAIYCAPGEPIKWHEDTREAGPQN